MLNHVFSRNQKGTQLLFKKDDQIINDHVGHVYNWVKCDWIKIHDEFYLIYLKYEVMMNTGSGK